MQNKKINLPEHAVIVPHNDLSPDALQGVIGQYISRDGIDSSHIDQSFSQKVEQVMQNLKTGKALLIYDQSTNTCNILSSSDPVLYTTEPDPQS